jgi:hypothetical protein
VSLSKQVFVPIVSIFFVSWLIQSHLNA